MTTTTKNAPGFRGNGPEGNDTHPTVQVGAEVMTTVPHTTDARPALRHHATWCSQCENVNNEWERHESRHRTVTLDGGGLATGLRNDPESTELTMYAYRTDDGPTGVELEVDTATSGCEDVMWLSLDEARRYAEAILAIVEEVQR